ncbi:hypothetical protein AQ490_18655 [Wenjunlia vitaminophila]|uniref:Cytochrome P450 n=1 Tax=Wenjunlia vitaminophila TaxID=76728 RepID=A0A0T6LVJ3_WENVI|nr:hypothetical protein [Wenjunlia vitaminophila]KRV49727.1 hypothetical protein AQ490_18655 [Wenjunlia vitaminophila]
MTSADHAAIPPPGCPAHPPGARFPLFGAECTADPLPVYAALGEQGPTAPVSLAPGVDALLVTGYQAALDVVRDPGTFVKDARRWTALTEGRVPRDSPVLPMMAYRPSALFADGDQHTRLRQAINDSLAQVEPNALRGYVETGARALIDGMAPQAEARLIAMVAIESLLDRLPDVELTPASRGVGLAARPLLPLPRRPTGAVHLRLRRRCGPDRPGGTSWTAPARPTRSDSTPADGTSTPNSANSAGSGPRRWLNSLVGWLRGR